MASASEAIFLAINELVEFRDKFGSEIRAVRQRGFLDTTRFGPDVVLSTLCCHADGLPNLLVVKKAHGKTSRHGSSGPLHVHLVSGPDNLEWSSIRHTSRCAEILDVDGIVRCPTFQGSLGHLSGCLLGLCVPLPQLPHDLRKAVTVLGILDGKTGLVPGLVPGFQGWKCPGTLAQTWH